MAAQGSESRGGTAPAETPVAGTRDRLSRSSPRGRSALSREDRALPSPQTAAATEATKRNAARIAATDPRKRDKALRIVGTGLVTGDITPADLDEHIRWVAESAPAPSAEDIAKLRALLPSLVPSDEAVPAA